MSKVIFILKNLLVALIKFKKLFVIILKVKTQTKQENITSCQKPTVLSSSNKKLNKIHATIYLYFGDVFYTKKFLRIYFFWCQK